VKWSARNVDGYCGADVSCSEGVPYVSSVTHMAPRQGLLIKNSSSAQPLPNFLCFLPFSSIPMASVWSHCALSPRIFSIQKSRQITNSATKAQPFFVNSLRSPINHENGDKKVLRMLMFGKPGAGKGTLSAKLVKKYDIMALSTGDLLRQHIAERWDKCSSPI
jgi:hypothetical protein